MKRLTIVTIVVFILLLTLQIIFILNYQYRDKLFELLFITLLFSAMNLFSINNIIDGIRRSG